MIIRELKLKDIDAAYCLGLENHRESDSNGLVVSPLKFIDLCSRVVNSSSKLGLVGEVNGGLAGMLFADITSPQWSSDYVAEEYLFFVRKKHRGGTLASKLIKEYIEWSKLFNVKKIFLSANSGYKTEKLARFYERRGFRMQGYNFVMEV